MGQNNKLFKVTAYTLTYATNVTPTPQLLLQLNKSVFSKQKEYTEIKYTETMTCSKLAANALEVKQIR